MTTEAMYRCFIYVALITLAISIVIPVAWVFLASVKQNSEFYGSPWAMPKSFYFQNFIDAFQKGKHGYLYVEFSHGNCVGPSYFIDCGFTSSLCVGKIYL
ncbi:hypothetical protein ACT7C4_18125 [Bacillus pacificus]